MDPKIIEPIWYYLSFREYFRNNEGFIILNVSVDLLEYLSVVFGFPGEVAPRSQVLHSQILNHRKCLFLKHDVFCCYE